LVLSILIINHYIIIIITYIFNRFATVTYLLSGKLSSSNYSQFAYFFGP